MAELDKDELASHRALHEKALKVAPQSGKEAGEYWAAVLDPDLNVLNWDSKDLHWFKVKGKHTVAKVQNAYYKICDVMTQLRQGNHIVPLTSQMKQINHFKDDVIIFWSTKNTSGDENSNISKEPLQSVGASTQNRMSFTTQTPAKIKPDPELDSIRMKTEPNLLAVSSSPFETPTISSFQSQAAQRGTPIPSGSGSGSAQSSALALKTITGYNMFADAHRCNYLHSKTSPAAVEASLKKSWTVLTPATREYWELKVPKLSSKNPTPVNPSAPDFRLGYGFFSELHSANYTSSSATPAEIESSLRRTWDKMAAETREYYSTKAAQTSDLYALNNGSLSPRPVVDTKPEPGSFGSSANGRPTSMARDDSVVESEDYASPKDEDGTPEPDLPNAELAKTRLQKIIEASSPEILEAEVKKTNNFLAELKTRFNVPEAQSHQDTKHWLQQIEILLAQGVDTPTIIGVVGNTGAGKSSVINAMLDEERLVPTNWQVVQRN
ncbi:hypothetical protein SBOR_8878 [Sclerotinia borealis F-4128]|uniref:Uncharacterized protein n=1 Tax=Sclerotinia borealis (strain F-4128) TaxID=1432307 RepID=W9C782_SCLBF|nr:hypothetical protein SBOR_8878 [Sclerotinia borealis F-4128]